MIARVIRRHSIMVGHVIGGLAAIAFSVIAGFAAYDVFTPVVVIRSQEVERKGVQQGGDLIVKLIVDRYRHCPVVVHQWVFDGRDIQHPIAPFAIEGRPLATGDHVNLIVPIPKTAATGKARYQLTFTHTCRVLFWESSHRTEMSYLNFRVLKERTRAQEEKPE